jgi:hypothetical protein
MRTAIDRTTDHTCPGLVADIAYFAAQGRSYFRCEHADGEVAIPVHYAQFSMLCAECRRECTDQSDVQPTTCAYCSQAL